MMCIQMTKFRPIIVRIDQPVRSYLGYVYSRNLYGGVKINNVRHLRVITQANSRHHHHRCPNKRKAFDLFVFFLCVFRSKCFHHILYERSIFNILLPVLWVRVHACRILWLFGWWWFGVWPTGQRFGADDRSMRSVCCWRSALVQSTTVDCAGTSADVVDDKFLG